MRAPRKLAKTLSRKFFFILVLMVIGFFGSLGICFGAIGMWLAGFIMIPLGIWRAPWRKEKQPTSVELPHFARWWDDTGEDSVRGKPCAMLVWEHDLSWPWATFLWLQFCNPLSNLRQKVKKDSKRG